MNGNFKFSITRTLRLLTLQTVLLALCLPSALAQRNLTIGSAQVFQASTVTRVQVAKIDESHVLVVYKDGTSATSSDIVARIGQVDTANKTITYGAATIVEGDLCRYGTPLVLSSTKAVVAYEFDTSTFDYGASRVIEFNLSTDAITNVGSKIAFSSDDVDAAFSHKPINLAKLTSSTFALMWSDDSDDGTVKIGTVSGTSITYGSEQKFSTGDVQNADMVALDTDKILITYEDDGSSDQGKAVVGSVSGTSITYGTIATFETSAMSYTACAAISTTQAAIAYVIDDANDYTYAKVATVSGTTITMSSSNYVLENGQDTRDLNADYLQGSEFVVSLNGGLGDNSVVRIGEISGTGTSASISYSTAVDFFSNEADDSRVTAINDNAIVLGYVDDNTGDHGECIVGTLPGSSPPPSVSMTGNTSVSCNGGSDGSLTATVTPGTANYDYVWSNGASTSNTSSLTNTITSLAAGTYTVTVTDDAGLTATVSATVTQPSALVSSASVTGALDCNGDTDGQVTASQSGGTSPYTYNWNTGETNAIETNLGANTYSVTVTDQNGCTDSASVTLTQPTALASSASVTGTLDCNGDTDGQVTATQTGGTSPYTYNWNTGETNAIETNLGANTYSVTVTDQNGCTDSSSVTLTQPTNMVASASVTGTLTCNGDTDGQVTASQTGGTSPYTYAWNTGGTSALETGLGAGTYSVTVTDQNGCTDSASVTLTQPTAMVASASVTGTLDCNGDTDGQVTATQTGGTSPYTYNWNTGETNAIETNLGANTYSVTVTDQNGCTDSASVTLTQPAAVIASATVQSALDCNGDTDGQVGALSGGGTTPYTYNWNTGETNAIETNLGAGTYSVTVTDQNGCTDSSSITLTQPTAMVASASLTGALDCNGDTDGQVTATQTGGTSPYTYNWNTGETNAIETNLGAGTYSVTVTDQNGCTDSASVTLTQPTAMVASASVTGTLTCNGDTDGQVTASQTGGTSPYTYAWNTGGTSALETGLGAGTYSVTVTDQNGCTDSASVTLTQPIAMVASASVTGALDCNGDTDGQLTATQTGGTSPYTYNWNTGETNAIETNLGAGTYSVTVTDQNGCTDSASVTLTEPAALSASASVTGTLDCNGDTDGQVTATQTGGTSPYTYNWNTGETNAIETNLGAGTYSVTVTDQNGCTDSSSITLTQPTAMVASASVTGALDCNGDTDGQVTATQTGGTSPYTYNWNTGETNAIETNLGAGTYSVTVTDQNGCTDSSSVTLTQPTAMVASASVTGTLTCNGDTDGQVTATQTGGTSPYTYSWNTGGTSALETGLGAGTYSVTVTDQNGCTDSASVTLTQPIAMVASASVTGTLDCNGDTDGQLTATQTGGTSPYTYTWNTGGTSAIETGLGAGTYSVTVTDQNGCTDSASVTLTEPAALSASASVTGTLDCNGDTDGQVTASQTGGTSPYTYSWNTGGTSALETGLGAGTYSVTVTDQNGCTDSASVTLTQPTAMVASASVTGTLDCNGDTDGQVTATQTGGTSPYAYNWNTGETNAIETNLGAGTYSVTVTDQNGCTDSTSVTLTQPTVLVAAAVVDSNVSCGGFADGGATASATGGTGTYTYAWSNSATTQSITGIIAGTYSVTITDANGCTDSTSVTITQPIPLVSLVTVNNNVSCNGLSDGQATASAVGGLTPYTFSWSNGATTAVASGLAAGTYSVTITEQNGCTDSSSVTITQPSAMIASASVTSALDCNGDTDAQVTASPTGGTTPYTYSWNTGGTLALETGLGAGTYSVTVTDQNGCTDSASVVVTQPAALVSSASVTSALACNGDTDGQVTATQTGGTSPYTYSWNTGGTLALETGLAAGTYSVTVTDQNGCTDSSSVTLTEPTALVLAVVSDSIPSCPGFNDGGLTANVTGGTTSYTYAWSNGATTQSITGIIAGSYTITVTDANGCTITANTSINDPTPLLPTIAIDSTVSCHGFSDGGATANTSGGTGAITYNWSNGATTASITGVVAGTYSVTLTDANGCTDSTSAVITEPSLLDISVSNVIGITCNGEIDGGIITSTTGGTTTYSYLWSNGVTDPDLIEFGPGTYTVTVTDANGCTDTASATLVDPPLLVASASVDSTVSCNGFSDGGATGSATGGTGSYTYAWSNGATSASISGVAAGTYSVTITDANGCTDSASTIITEPTILVATSVVDSNVSCGGLSDGGATASATGGTGSYTFIWSNSATTQSITGIIAGTYSVTITDANGCTDSSSITITEPPTLVAAATVDSTISCNGFSDGGATALATGGTGSYTYNWSNSATTASITGVLAGTYSVTITDANGCTDSTSATITEPASLVAAANIDFPILCHGVPDGGASASVTGGTGPYTYLWSTSDTDSSLIELGAGTYSVTITDANGCTDSASVTLVDPPLLIATTIVDSNVTCNGFSNGGATANPTGGTGSYTYAWSNGATSQSVTGVVAGTYTVTVTDANGCSDANNITITEPTVLSVTAVLDSNENCVGSLDGGVSSTNTGGTTPYTYLWSNSGTTSAITGIGAGTYTITTTDANGCASLDSISVVVLDAIPPVAVAQNITVYLDINGVATIAGSDLNNGSTDNCGVLTFSVDDSTFNCADIGTPVSVIMTASDLNGNSDTASATITVLDTINPVAIAQNLTVHLDVNGQALITANDINSGSYDSCGIANLSISDTSFDCSDVGTPSSVLLTVTDNHGNVDTASSIVTVLDTISPNAVAQNLTVYLDNNGQANILASQVDNASSDACGIDTIILDITSFTCADVGGGVPVVLTVTDVNGNSATANATITVLDTIAPIAIAQNLIVHLDNDGLASITATDIDNNSSDSCGIQSLAIDTANFDCGNIGTPVPVTLTVTDNNGNTSTASAVITVLDTVSPIAVAQNLTVYLDNIGQASITANDVDNGSSDSCGIASLVIDSSNFDCANTAAPVTVTLTVTDNNGNISTAVSTVTILDTISPVAIAQNLNVYLDNTGLATITSSDVDNGSSDNCAIDTITIDNSSFDCSDVGTPVTITMTVTDDSGNQSTATATATVLDTVAPIAIAQNLTVYLDNVGQASITPNDIDNGSSDSCGIQSLVIDTSNFDCGNVGTPINVTLTVTDVNGNTNDASAIITVLDTVSPTAIAQNLTVYLDNTGSASIVPTDIDNGSSDACGISSLALDVTSFDCNDLTSPVTVTLTVTDSNSNVSTAAAQVTVLDTVSPDAIAQNLTVYLDNSGLASIVASDVDNSSTDNCVIDTRTIDISSFDCSDVGTPITVTLTITDESGNSDTDQSTITVLDTISPNVITQNVNVYLDNSGNASIIADDIDNGSSDSCGVASKSIDISSFDCNDLTGPVTVTLTITDVNANDKSATAQVTVLDTINPTATTQNIDVYLDNVGQATIVPADIDNGSFDNCTVDNLQLDISNFDCADVNNPVTVVLTVTDQSGNQDTAHALVTVLDTVSPDAQAQNVTVYLDNGGNVSIIPADIDNGSSDACGIDTMMLDISDFSCGDLFNPVSIVLTVVDSNGNSDTAQAVVTVMDTLAPVISCQADTTTGNDIDTCGAFVSYTIPTATDNCPIFNIQQIDTSNLTSGSFFPVGITEQVYVVTDTSGNTDTCKFIVTVLDTQAPVIVCPSDTVVCEEIITYNLPIATDNCDSVAITLISGVGSGGTFPVGVTTEVYVVTDTSGNTDTCSFTIQRDAEPTVAVAGIDQALCDATTTTLDGNQVLIGTGVWSVLTGGSTITDTLDSASDVTGLDIGLNEFVWTTSNGVCPSISDTVKVTVDALPTVATAGIDQSLCDAGTTQLSGNGAQVGTGVWSLIEGNGIFSDSLDSATTVDNLVFGPNTFVWTISNGVCPPTMDTVTVIDNVLPTVEAGLDLDIFTGLGVQLMADTTLTDSIEWSPAINMNNPFIINPIATSFSTTTYTVTVTSPAGCTATDALTINVGSQEDNLPTAITPNGDGMNDEWNIKGLENYPDCVVEIRDRNGGVVFESTGYREPWDGKFNGNDLPVASYYFVIDLKDGVNKPFSGIITIIR